MHRQCEPSLDKPAYFNALSYVWGKGKEEDLHQIMVEDGAGT
jgi:hypothetical protein